MIPEPGVARAVPVPETFHEQTKDELTEAEIKQMEANDQAIQTILLDLPKDIYAVVDKKKAKLFNKWERFTSTDGESIESYYHCFSKLMNDFKRNKHFPEKIASNLKFLNNLQPKWSRHVTIVHQTKDLHTAGYTQLYDFLKYNQKENYMQQPVPNPEDITDPTAIMNMELVLMIAQSGMNLGQDNQMQMVGGNGGNQFRQYVGQNVGNQNRNGNVVAARAKGNANGNNGNQIRCYNSRGLGHLDRNCTVKPRRRDAAYLQTQFKHRHRALRIFNMFTQEKQYTELLEPIPEPHQVQQNDSNVNSAVSSVEQGGGTVEQHPANVKETRVLYDSLYNNLAIEVEKVNLVNRKLRETNAELTTELARYKNQEKCFEISQEKYDKLERCYQQFVYQEQCLTKRINALHLSTGKQITALNEEISNLNKQLSKEKSTISSLQEEKKRLKSDFKIRKDELLDKQIQLENKIKELDNILVKTASDEEIEGPMKDQPLSADASPTALSPGYIADSDPEEDKEDPEEDPADHPADG
ncbi:hypothetical protein Tco_0490433 [Tanacetum coccineum]